MDVGKWCTKQVQDAVLEWLKASLPDHNSAITSFQELKNGLLLFKLLVSIQEMTAGHMRRNIPARPFARFHEINKWIAAKNNMGSIYSLNAGAILNSGDVQELCKASVLLLYLGSMRRDSPILAAGTALSPEHQDALKDVLKMVQNQPEPESLLQGPSSAEDSSANDAITPPAGVSNSCANPQLERVMASSNDSPLMAQLLESPITGRKKQSLFSKERNLRLQVQTLQDEKNLLQLERENDCTTMKKEIEELRHKLSSLQSLYRSCYSEEQYSELEEDANRLKAANQCLERRVADLEEFEDRATLLASVTDDDAEKINALKEENTALAIALENANSSSDSYSEQLESLAMQISNINEELTRTKRQLTDKEQEVEGLEWIVTSSTSKPAPPSEITAGENLGDVLLMQAQEEVEQLKEQNAALEHQLSSTSEQLAEKREVCKQNAILEARLKESEEQYANLTHDLATQETAFTIQLEGAKKNVSDLQTEILEKEKVAEILQETCKQSREEADAHCQTLQKDYDIEIGNLEQQLTVQANELETGKATISELSCNSQVLQDRNQELTVNAEVLQQEKIQLKTANQVAHDENVLQKANISALQQSLEEENEKLVEQRSEAVEKEKLLLSRIDALLLESQNTEERLKQREAKHEQAHLEQQKRLTEITENHDHESALLKIESTKLKGETGRLQELNATLRLELSTAAEQLAEKSRVCDQVVILDARLEESEQLCANLTHDLATQETSFTVQLEGARKNVSDLEAEILEKEKEAEVLQETCKQSREEADSYCQTLQKDCDIKIGNLEQQLALQANELETGKATISELSCNRQLLQDLNQELTEKVQVLQQEKSQLSTAIQVAQEENVLQSANISALQQSLEEESEKLVEQRRKAVEKEKILLSRIDALLLESQNTEERLKQREAKHEQAHLEQQKRLTEITENHDHESALSKMESTKLMGETERLQELNATLRHELSTAAEQLTEKSRVCEQVVILDARLEESEKLCANLTQDLSTQETAFTVQVENAKKDISDLQAEIFEKEKEAEILQETCKQSREEADAHCLTLQKDLDIRIGNLEQQLALQANELETGKAEISELNSNRQVLQDFNKELNEKIEVLQQENNQLSTANQVANAENVLEVAKISALQASIEKEREKLIEQEGKAVEKEKHLLSRIDKLLLENQNTEDRLKQREAEHEQTHLGQRERLTELTENHNHESALLKMECAKLKDETEQLQELNVTLKLELSTAAEQLTEKSQVCEQNVILKARLEESEKLCANLTQNLTAQETAFNVQLESAKKDISDLQAEILKNEKEADIFQNLNQQLSEKVGILQQENDQLSNANQGANDENVLQSAKISALQQSLEEESEKLIEQESKAVEKEKHLLSTIDELSLKGQNAEERLTQREAEHEQAHLEQRERQTEITENHNHESALLKMESTKLKDETEQLQEQIANLQLMLSSTIEQLTEKSQVCEQVVILEARLEESEKQYANLTQDLATQETAFTVQLESAKKDVSDHQAEILKKEKETDIFQNLNQQLSEKVGILQQENDQLSNANQEANDENVLQSAKISALQQSLEEESEKLIEQESKAVEKEKHLLSTIDELSLKGQNAEERLTQREAEHEQAHLEQRERQTEITANHNHESALLKMESTKLKDETEQLQEQIANLQLMLSSTTEQLTEKSQVCEQVVILEARLEESEKQYANLTQDLATQETAFTVQLESAKKDVSDHQAEILKKEKETDIFQDLNQQLSEKVGILQQENDQLSNANQGANDENVLQSAKISALQQSLEEETEKLVEQRSKAVEKEKLLLSRIDALLLESQNTEEQLKQREAKHEQAHLEQQKRLREITENHDHESALLKINCTKLKGETERLQELIANLQLELSTTTEQLTEKSQVCEQVVILQARLEESERQCANLTQDLTTQETTFTVRLEGAKKNVSDLQAEILKKEKEAEILQETCKQSREEADAHCQTLQKDCDINIGNLEQQLALQADELETGNAKISELHSNSQVLQDLSQELSEKVEVLQQENGHLSTANQVANDVNVLQSAKISALQQSLEEKNEKLIEQEGKAVEKERLLLSRIDELSLESRNAEEQLEQRESEHKQAHLEQRERLTEMTENHNHETELVKMECTKLKGETEQLQELIANLQLELSITTEQLTEMSQVCEQVVILEARLEESEKLCANLTQDLTTQETTFTVQLENVKKDITDLQAKVADEEKKVILLEDIKKDHEKKLISYDENMQYLERYKVCYKEKKKTIEQLNHQLKLANAQLSKYKAGYEMYKEKCESLTSNINTISQLKGSLHSISSATINKDSTLNIEDMDATIVEDREDKQRSSRLSTAESQRRKSLVSNAAAVKTYGDDEADVLIDSTLRPGDGGGAFTESASAFGLIGDSLCKDEDPNARIAEFKKRNARYMPHMRSAYAIESQAYTPSKASGDDIREGRNTPKTNSGAARSTLPIVTKRSLAGQFLYKIKNNKVPKETGEPEEQRMKRGRNVVSYQSPVKRKVLEAVENVDNPPSAVPKAAEAFTIAMTPKDQRRKSLRVKLKEALTSAKK